MNRTLWKYLSVFALMTAAWNIIWSLYNNYAPLYLQAGNPNFQVPAGAAALVGFGLGPFAAGIVMSIDNLAALIVGPLVGLWSDRVRRRLPFILYAVPVIAVATALLPFVVGMISPAQSGNLAALTVPFILFMLCAIALIGGWIATVVPDNTLQVELVPSPTRSKFFGFMSVATGLLGFVVLFLTPVLYGISSVLPFIVGAILIALAGVAYKLVLREPAQLSASSAEEVGQRSVGSIFAAIRDLQPVERNSLIMMMVTYLFSTFGIGALQTFGSSYATTVLKLPPANTILVVLAYFAGSLVMGIPAGYIGAKIGRRRTIRIGQVGFIVFPLIAFFVPVMPVVIPLIFLIGASAALMSVNTVPTFSDILAGGRSMGMVMGFVFFTSMLSTIIAVPTAGALLQLFGSNYNILWLITAATSVIAFIALFFVKRGEAQA